MIIRRFTRFASVLAIVALVLSFYACDQVEQLLVPPAPEIKEVVIGVDLPLTGQYAEPYGLPMQRGFELARQELNEYSDLTGLQFTFITEDDQSTVEGAVEAFNKLIHQDGMSIITGLALSTQGAAVFPIAQENSVVCFSSLSSAAGLSAIGDFIFRAPLTLDVLNPIGVRLTHEKLGYTRVALIYDEADVYSTSSKEEFEKTLGVIGIEIVAIEPFQTGATDFSAQLTTIMAANPDVIFVSALAPAMASIMTQGRMLGIPDAVRFIVPELTADEVEAAGDAAEGAISFSSWFHKADTPDNQAFVEGYRTTYGIEPEPWAAQSYATFYILAEAIISVQSTEATAVRDALATTKNLDTILGDFSFNADGDAVYDPIVLVVENGEVKVFK